MEPPLTTNYNPTSNKTISEIRPIFSISMKQKNYVPSSEDTDNYSSFDMTFTSMLLSPRLKRSSIDNITLDKLLKSAL